MMEDRLGERYVRLDATWPPKARLGIDVATPEAKRTLERLARETIQRSDKELLDLKFLRPRSR